MIRLPTTIGSELRTERQDIFSHVLTASKWRLLFALPLNANPGRRMFLSLVLGLLDHIFICTYVKYIEVSQTLCFRRFSRRQTHNKFALTPLQIDMYIYICKYIGKVWPLDQRKISPILHVPVPGQLERGTRERSSSTFPISRAEAPHHTRRQNITNPTNMPVPVDSHHCPLI